MILGSAGVVLGGFLWIIITGIVLESALTITTSSILAAASLLISVCLYIRYPEKWLIILGSLIILVVIANFVFINLLYPKIPEFVGEISTGKNQMGLLQVNIFLGLFSLWGIFCIFLGIFRKKIQEKNTVKNSKYLK